MLEGRYARHHHRLHNGTHAKVRGCSRLKRARRIWAGQLNPHLQVFVSPGSWWGCAMTPVVAWVVVPSTRALAQAGDAQAAVSISRRRDVELRSQHSHRQALTAYVGTPASHWSHNSNTHMGVQGILLCLIEDSSGQHVPSSYQLVGKSYYFEVYSQSPRGPLLNIDAPIAEYSPGQRPDAADSR